MATTKAKSTKKPAAKKVAAKKPAPKSKTTAKAKVAPKAAAVKATKVGAVKTKIVSEKSTTGKKNPVKEFFARKGDPNENILTIFKDTKIIGALIGEIVGAGLVTAVALALPLFSLDPIYAIFAYIGIIAAVFALSGAHLNPIITAGMMASRRISAIRGVLYIIAQLLGSWFGFLVISYFYNQGIASGNITAETMTLPTLVAAGNVPAATEGFSFFWAITLVEFIGAIIIAFFFARALEFKRGAFTFAAVVAGGIFLAKFFAVFISLRFIGTQENLFIMNPAAAFMQGLLPSGAEGFDALMGQLWPMLVTYVIFPVFGGVLGFYLSDFANKLSGKELKA